MADWTGTGSGQPLSDDALQPQQPVTSEKLLGLRDNPIAITEGAPGAPKIQRAAFAGGDGVDQALMRSATGTVSFSREHQQGAGAAVRTLPGGQYGFIPELRVTNDVFAENGKHAFMLGRAGTMNPSSFLDPTPVLFRRESNPGYSYRSECTLLLHVSGDNVDDRLTLYARQRFVDGSPPYDLGNGEVPLFVFAHILPSGSVAGAYVSTAPPWAHNGPTDITPHRIDSRTGKKYQRRRRLAVTMDDVRDGRADLADYAAALREAPEEWVELTPAMKNADMHRHPHSWEVEPTEGEIVLLDPCGELCADLYELHQAGEDVADLIHAGYLKITAEDCGANCPPRTRSVKVGWKRRQR